MRKKIFITRKLQDEVVVKLSQYADVDMWELEEVPIPKEELLKRVRDVDGLLTMISEQIDAEVMESARNLKVIANMAVGYNNIDVNEAKKRNIIVTNTPDVLTDTTADLAFALLLATSRRLIEASDYLREGKWQSWYPTQLTGRDLTGSTLGIFGLGRIGAAVAKRARGFDMNILYHNRSRNEELEKVTGAKYVSKDELLQQSDFIVILMPYSQETVDYITKAELEQMKETAILINVARGGIVNEDDLYEALVANKIWAAGLDVFAKEPVNLNNPLLTLKNVVALPHIGSASIDTRLNMAMLAADNLIAIITEKEPLTAVTLN